MSTKQGTVWVWPYQASLLATISANVKAGERVLILPEPHAIDALFGLRDASPLLYAMPGWLDERAEDRLLDLFARKPPDVVVLFARATQEFGIEPFGQGYGRGLDGWIQRNYRVAAYNPMVTVFRRGSVP